MPASTAGMRQPKARLPNSRMPTAISCLPISGCGQETSLPAVQRSGGIGPTLLCTMTLASFA